MSALGGVAAISDLSQANLVKRYFKFVQFLERKKNNIIMYSDTILIQEHSGCMDDRRRRIRSRSNEADINGLKAETKTSLDTNLIFT